MPSTASAAVSVHTKNGDIMSDFPIPTSDDENKSASFTIGGGQAKIQLTTDNGDIRIKRGSGFPAVPPPPTASGSKAPEAPAAPNAPHLKTPKPLPPAPVTQ